MGMLQAAMPLLGETPESVRLIGLIDDLSVGDISDLEDREARAFGVCPWKDDPEFAGEVSGFISSYFEKALPAFAQTEEALIWYGDSAAEQCGMLRAAHDLYQRGVPFSLVHVDRLNGLELPPPALPEKGSAASAVFVLSGKRVLNFTLNHTPQWLLKRIVYRERLHRYRERRKTVVLYRGVGELEPETASLFYRKQRRVPECEAKLLYTRWEQLTRENTPLRVMRNKKPVSAPADYYDAAILANTPKKETAAAVVVGRTLSEFAVSDCLIFERIRALAAAGKLEIVKNGGNYRETTIRKAAKG